MSTIDPAVNPDEIEEAAPADAEELLPTFDSPIVPNSTISGRALVAVVAITAVAEAFSNVGLWAKACRIALITA